MAQVSYTVGVLDASSNLVYSGTLEVQMLITNLGATPGAGVLSLDGFQPVIMVAVGGGGESWSFTGENSTLGVETTALSPAVQPFDQAPSYLAGSIALTPAGKPQQELLMLGFDGSATPAVSRTAPRADESGAADASGAVEVSLGIPPVHYHFSLQLLNTDFTPSGSGTFTGMGLEVQAGPVSRHWSVSGNLSLNGGEEVPIQGWGSTGFWSGSGTTSGDTAIALSFVPETFISGSADGTVTVGTETSFFVGTSVAARKIDVQGIAVPAAEPA